jgi:hypothetical protein
VLIALYVLAERATDMPSQALVVLVLLILVKRWYDTESLRNRVEDLERQVEDHYWDFHHKQRDADDDDTPADEQVADNG